jgi:tetratricopeptide (TPR) repeat protein
MLPGVLLTLILALPISGEDARNVNPLELNPEMKQFIKTKAERGLPPLQRLHSLVAAVFQSNDLHFSYAPVTRTAAETFESRNGNCLSFTLLFISMARHLNLDARFHEVEVPPIFSKSGAFVKISQHLNAVVFIGGQVYSIDIFPEVVPIVAGGRIVSDQRGFAHFFNNKGVDELGKGNHALADAYLKRALEIDSSAIAAWINLGAIRAQAAKFNEAAEYYRMALNLDSKNLAAMSNLASVYEMTGRTKESLRLQRKVKEFRDRNPYYHFDLGFQAYQQGDYKAALAHYEKAIKLKSTDHNFYFAVARVYTKIGQEKQAMAQIQLAEKYASDPEKKMMYAQKLELLKARRFPAGE